MFTQTRVDDDGYPVRDPDSSSYLATFEAAAAFGIMMAAEARTGATSILTRRCQQASGRWEEI